MRRCWLIIVVLGCAGGDSCSQEGDLSAGMPGAIGLAHQTPVLLELPPTSRPKGAAPERWRLVGKWKKLRSNKGRTEYTVRAPYRVVFYGEQGGTKPAGMKLQLEKPAKTRFVRQKKVIGPPGTWGLHKNQLIFRVADGDRPPTKAWVKVPGATALERSMNMDTADATPEAFAFRTLDRRQSRSHGLFLPAPGQVAWEVQVPQRGQLEMDAELLSPPVRTKLRSDGAVVVVTVDAGDGPEEVMRHKLKPGRQAVWGADLTRWAGQSVRLAIQTQGKGSTNLDYVFLGDPVLFTPSDTPRRALVVFVDTLRQDHLGLYGYPRPTSPVIDALGAAGVVFEQARAPSPWTLPSALAAMYGRDPEIIQGQPHLGERLSAEGWATCAVVSNNWLTGPDTLGSGWSQQRARRGAKAAEQVKRAARCLEKYPNRDALVFVHLIDPHLPYMEADAFRGRFAGPAPAKLPERVRHSHAREAYAQATTDEERADIKQYLIDRYDQNILAVDAAVAQLLQAVGEDAIVAFFSDHGEEFWEHGGFEHGHTLYDELMLVPMILRAPGLDPARVTASVGLTDLVPTLLELLGLPAAAPVEGPGAAGRSLVALSRGEAGAQAAFQDRPISLGRVLFADDHWGAVHQGFKWVANGRQEHLWDLGADPGEQTDLASGAELSAWPGQLSEALGRPVQRVLRVAGPGTKRHIKGGESTLQFRHPAPILAAWTRLDPHSSFADPELSDGAVTVRAAKGQKVPREIFLQLSDGASAEGLTVRWKQGGRSHKGVIPAQAEQGVLLQIGPDNAPLTVAWTWQPLPLTGEGVTYSGEVTQELRALGYVE